MDGWRGDVGYPEDRERAERLLQGEDMAETDEHETEEIAAETE